jgi:hypothetical protein
MQEGEKKGRQENQQELVVSMLAEHLPLETNCLRQRFAIARVTKLSISEVERFAIKQIQEIQAQ